MRTIQKTDDRGLATVVVASLWGLVFGGAMYVAYDFGNVAGLGLVMLSIAVVFVLLAVGWRDAPPKPSEIGPAPVMGEIDPVTRERRADRGAPSAVAAPAPEAAAPEPMVTGEPAPITDDTVGRRPAGLDGPRDGQPDDLKLIKGVGPALEALCHRLGFYHFDQIANWSDDEVAWVDANLEGFKGRVSRDDWIAQAKDLAAGQS